MFTGPAPTENRPVSTLPTARSPGMPTPCPTEQQTTHEPCRRRDRRKHRHPKDEEDQERH